MKKGITGKHILLMMIGFFAVVFAVNGVFVTLAVKSFPGETERKSYLQGLNYNETLEKRRVQADMGWSAQIGVDTDSVGAPMLLTRIYDSSGRPLSSLEVNATATQHGDEHQILELALALRNAGEYSADAAVFTPGRWNVQITANSPEGAVFEAEKTLVIK